MILQNDARCLAKTQNITNDIETMLDNVVCLENDEIQSEVDEHLHAKSGVHIVENETSGVWPTGLAPTPPSRVL